MREVRIPTEESSLHTVLEAASILSSLTKHRCSKRGSNLATWEGRHLTHWLHLTYSSLTSLLTPGTVDIVSLPGLR